MVMWKDPINGNWYDRSPSDLLQGTGAGAGTITSVNGQTGPVVTLTAADVGAATASALAAETTRATAAEATRAPLLTPTAVKTAPYTAAVGDLALMNVAGGGTTLTLPTAPADGAQVGYRAIGATTAVPLVVNRGGTDTIGLTAATTVSVPLADETVLLQYQAAGTRWLAVSNVKTQASLTPAALGAEPAISRTGAVAGNVLGYDGTNLSFGAPVSPGPSYNIQPTAFRKLRKGLADVRGGVANATIMCKGDSTTESNTLLTDYADCWPAALARLLNYSLVPCAMTWMTSGGGTNTKLDPRVNVGAWNPNNSKTWWSASTINSPIGFTPTFPRLGPPSVDTFEVYTWNGSYSASVNGGAATTWTTTSDGTGRIDKTVITCPAGPSNVLTVMNTSTSGYICYVNAYLSTAKMLMIGNWASSGVQSSFYACLTTQPSYGASAAARVVLPALAIADLGINDATAGVTAAQYQTNMTGMVDFDKQYTDVLLKSMVPAGAAYAGNLTLENQYRTALQSIRDSRNVGYLDGFARWESYGVSSPLGYYAPNGGSPDGTHPSASGYGDIAAAVASVIRQF